MDVTDRTATLGHATVLGSAVVNRTENRSQQVDSYVTLGELCRLVGGQLIGSQETQINSALPLQDAVVGSITMADSARQLPRLVQSRASAVIVTHSIDGCNVPMLVVENIHAAFDCIIRFLRPPSIHKVEGISPTAVIHSAATIGPDTCIGQYSTIGANVIIGARCIIHDCVHVMAGTRIGDDCEIFPGVTIYHDCKLGNHVLIHANAVIGAFGFGYRQKAGRHERTAQLGWVELEDHVEIGAGTTVDRGTYGCTRIGSGTKIDNQVQIGHNCHIGANNLICAQVGIAGSCKTGNYVVLAGQVGIADHVNLSDHVVVGAQSGIMQDVGVGETVLGTPAGPARQKMKEVAAVSRIMDMRKELRDLQNQFESLLNQLNDPGSTKLVA